MNNQNNKRLTSMNIFDDKLKSIAEDLKPRESPLQVREGLAVIDLCENSNSDFYESSQKFYKLCADLEKTEGPGEYGKDFYICCALSEGTAITKLAVVSGLDCDYVQQHIQEIALSDLANGVYIGGYRE